MNEVQYVILDIFKNVKYLCDLYNIPYYAIGGTCLGAARHKGFIPWDDDIDIAIPINYKSEFEKICNEHLPENLKLYSYKDCVDNLHIFSKVINVNTAFIEESEFNYPERYKGIFIDVMWISSVPSSKVSQTIFKHKIIILSILNYVRKNDIKELPTKKHKFIKMFLNIFNPKLHTNYFTEKWIKLISKYPLGSTEYTGYVWNQKIKKFIFPMTYFDGTEELPFEDTFIKCPVKWHEYLTSQFGDYMKCPEENNRVSDHSGIIDIHRSYKEYIKNPELIKRWYKKW